jgi:hypothetical protein
VRKCFAWLCGVVYPTAADNYFALKTE